MNEAPIDTAALPQDGQEHRLHPLSWLFVLLAQALVMRAIGLTRPPGM